MRLADHVIVEATTHGRITWSAPFTCPTPTCSRNPWFARVGHHNFPLASRSAKPKRNPPVGPKLARCQRTCGIHTTRASGINNFPLAREASNSMWTTPVGPNLPDASAPPKPRPPARRAPNFPLANGLAPPREHSPVGPNFPGHRSADTHFISARDLTTKRSR